MTPKTKSFLLSLFLSILFFFVLIAIGDYILGLFTKPNFTTTVDSPLYEGHLLASDKVVTQTFNFESGTHVVHYTLTKGRYRYTPVEHPELRDKFIALFGCSFVFGTTVEDNQTIPAYIGKNKTDCMPYNFGKPGGALQHTYYHLIHLNIGDEIKQQKGLFIYLYGDFHFRRIIGGIPSPEITADSLFIKLEKGNLLEKGTFREAMPWRWRFYELLRYTSIPWALNISFPLNAPQPEHWDLIVALFVKSAEVALNNFPDSRFIIAFWNAPNDKIEIMRRIYSLNTSIKCIDLDEALSGNTTALNRFPDRHFYPESNELIAKSILKCISE